MAIEDIITGGVELLARVLVSQAIADATSAGRDAGFDEFLDEFQGAQYSALLDDRVCDYCASLDGLYVDLRTEEGLALYDKYSPAQHENCRCQWVMIGADESGFKATPDFEKTWEDKFKAISAGKPHADLSTHQIIDRFARFNWQSRPELWGAGDLAQFQQIADDKRRKRIEQKMKKQFAGMLRQANINTMENEG